jgi:hypothetical protein
MLKLFQIVKQSEDFKPMEHLKRIWAERNIHHSTQENTHEGNADGAYF